MKFLTEIIVLYDDVDMPSEDMFCPSFWASERFDSDGDFYFDGAEKCWTNLQLEKQYKDSDSSYFVLNVYREKNRQFGPAVMEAADLARYIDYKDAGRYAGDDRIENAANLAVASLSIRTVLVEDYKEYLETVYEFLRVTNGMTANLYTDLDADEFLEKIIGQ